MPTNLSLEELQVLAERHTAHELTHDIVALMATVHPDPCWSFEPIGYDVTTSAAVTEMYQRMFPLMGATTQSKVINSWFSDDGFIAEVQVSVLTPDKGEVELSLFSWCAFIDALMSGEGVYLDTGYADLLTRALGASFFTYPGVRSV